MVSCWAPLVMSVACLMANMLIKTSSLGYKGSMRKPRDCSGVVTLKGRGVQRIPVVTSLGRSTKTGPGCPDITILNTLLILWGVEQCPWTQCSILCSFLKYWWHQPPGMYQIQLLEHHLDQWRQWGWCHHWEHLTWYYIRKTHSYSWAPNFLWWSPPPPNSGA